MQLQLQGAYLDFFPDLRAYVERRLAGALGRCRAPARRATVSLKQRKQARRVIEWCCAIRVLLQGQAVRVDATGPLPSGAIDGAIGRLGTKLARAVSRRPKGAPRRRTETAPVQPQWGGRSLDFAPRARRHR